MWASGQPDEVARAWMEAALADVSQYQEPILLAAALSSTMRTTLMQQATTPAALLLAAKAIAVGIEPTSEQLLTIAQRLFDLNDPTIPPTKSDGIKPVLADASRIQREYDGPTWRFRLALAQLPPAVQLRRSTNVPSEPRRTPNGASSSGHSWWSPAADSKHGRRPGSRLSYSRFCSTCRRLSLARPRRRESRRMLVIGSSKPILSGRLDAMAEAMESGRTHR